MCQFYGFGHVSILDYFGSLDMPKTWHGHDCKGDIQKNTTSDLKYKTYLTFLERLRLRNRYLIMTYLIYL